MAGHDDKGDDAGRGPSPGPTDESPHHQAPVVAPGTYESVCPDCAGTGKLKDGQTCPTCDGAGWVTPVGH
jgi:DnaJ-class molecular chaperone